MENSFIKDFVEDKETSIKAEKLNLMDEMDCHITYQLRKMVQ